MHSLTAFLLATILALAFLPAPQVQKSPPPQVQAECGTTVTPEELKAELARNADPARKNNTAQTLAPPTGAPYALPLTIHMVERVNIVDAFNRAQTEIIVQRLNQLFQPVGIQFFIYGEIDIITSDEHYNALTREKENALLKVNRVPNTINVYFANTAKCGRGTFTWDDAEGIVLNYVCFNLFDHTGYEILAHEIGHYLNLYHTHETANGVECPNGNNCGSAGDQLCDTPADPNLAKPKKVDAYCVYNNSVPPPVSACKDDTPYNPLTNNLMSEPTSECRNQFTAGQINKMLQTLRSSDERKNLINGKTRYVDRLASASNTKCTYDAPCRTVATAMQAAKDGDALFLKWGTYAASSIGGKRVSLNRWGFENGVVIWP